MAAGSKGVFAVVGNTGIDLKGEKKQVAETTTISESESEEESDFESNE